MLGGAGALNADKLSLDLQFATDKTLTARKGPTPTFTRASTATFVGSDGLIQSAAVNAARFDHDPVTLACKGLLIEEARTNNLQRSEEFNDAYWVKTRTTITTNATTAPDGTVSADKVVDTATSGDHNTSRSSIAVSPQQTLSYSVFVKADERTQIQLRMQEGVNGVDCFFNLSTLATTPSQFGTGSGSTGTIFAYPNGWYRCIITGRPSASTGTTTNIVSFLASGGSVSYTGDGTSGLFLWGAQLEAGSFPTSYIPTVASSVVRSADVCSITGSAFTGMYNATEGTVFADVITPDVDQAGSIYYMNTFAGVNANAIFKLNSSVNAPGKRWTYFSTNAAGVPQAQITTTTDVAVLRSKVASAYKVNDFVFAHAGTIIATVTSGTLPAPTQMGIGSRVGSTIVLNGHIATLRYYKKRLANAKLTSLTA
jgi:hypothetical protein